MSPLRVLLIGAGSMGGLHARVLTQHPLTTLVGIVDPDPAARAALATKYETTGLPEVGSLTGIDAVVIAATTEHHYTIAAPLLDAGLPLLVEKPLTPRIEETRALVKASADKGVPLMCGLLERYNPAILTAQQLISRPHLVQSVRHSPYVPRIKTGVGWDLLIHDVDLAMRVVPDTPAHALGMAKRFSPMSLAAAEDVVEATIAFEGGAIATASASRLAQRKMRSMTVYELDRMVEIDLLQRTVTVHHHVAAEAMTADGRGYRQQTIIEIAELVTSREPLTSQLDRFCELVRGQADPAEERDAILPAHEVVAQILGGQQTVEH
jgi:predicted dehydrogenase